MARFVIAWLCGLLGLTACLVAFNVAVDPYGILDMPRVPGLNAEKVAGPDWPDLTKPYLVQAANPQTIVLGSSKVDIGINPESPAWPEADRPVYNLAVDGAPPDAQLRLLRHALATTHPKLVLLGVSFEDALIYPQPKTAALAKSQTIGPSRLRVTADGSPNPDYARARLQDFVFATLSLHALADSVSTLLHQGDPNRPHQTRFGQNNGGDLARWVGNEGQYTLVMEKDRQKAPQLISWVKEPKIQIQPVGDAVRLVRASGANAIVFIMPSYVDLTEMLRQVGLIRRLEIWRAELTATVEQASMPGDPTPIWDFSGISPYTTEALPAPGDRSGQMKWTWETIHFRDALGELMLQRMLHGDGPEGFGVPITTSGLPYRDAAFEREQREWVATHPDDVARVAAVLAAAANTLCHSDLAECLKPSPQTTASR